MPMHVMGKRVVALVSAFSAHFLLMCLHFLSNPCKRMLVADDERRRFVVAAKQQLRAKGSILLLPKADPFLERRPVG